MVLFERPCFVAAWITNPRSGKICHGRECSRTFSFQVQRASNIGWRNGCPYIRAIFQARGLSDGMGGATMAFDISCATWWIADVDETLSAMRLSYASESGIIYGVCSGSVPRNKKKQLRESREC